MKFKITKNDSSDIAFAENCLMSGAISQDELRQWLYHIIEHMEDPPTYIFELMDEKDLRIMFRGVNGPMGFFATNDLNRSESDAVMGIAYKRGHYDPPREYDVSLDRAGSIKALDKNPHIERRFREMFPFIVW